LPGVRYSIQVRSADGGYTESDPNAPVRSGASVRLHLEANQPGTLTVARRDSDGTWKPWGEAVTRTGEPVYLPADAPVTIDAAGDLHLRVRFSPGARAPAAEALAANPNLLRDQAGTSVYVVNPQRGAGLEFEIVVRAQ
jgi:hypothetical protein